MVTLSRILMHSWSHKGRLYHVAFSYKIIPFTDIIKSSVFSVFVIYWRENRLMKKSFNKVFLSDKANCIRSLIVILAQIFFMNGVL